MAVWKSIVLKEASDLDSKLYAFVIFLWAIDLVSTTFFHFHPDNYACVFRIWYDWMSVEVKVWFIECYWIRVDSEWLVYNSRLIHRDGTTNKTWVPYILNAHNPSLMPIQ